MRYKVFAAFIAMIVLAGCGNMRPVNGKVVFADGATAVELSGHLIMLQSVEHKVGASGVIRADGTFTLGTHTDSDGAMLGKHRVAITPPVREINKPAPKIIISDRYGKFETSNLEVEIQSGTNLLVLTVDRLK